MGWLIALAVVVAIGFLRVGVFLSYDVSGAAVRLCVGPFKFHLKPGKKKEAEKKAPKKAASGKAATSSSDPAQPKPKKRTGGPLSDFLPLVNVLLDFLGDCIGRLRFQDLRLKLILAGDDPCDLAVNYGRAWAALGDLAPLLDNRLRIGRRDLEIECDFEEAQTTVAASVTVTLSIGRALYLTVRYGWKGLKELIILKNKRKGGAEK